MSHRVKAVVAPLSAVLLLVAGVLVGTNFVTAAPVSVTVSFEYNGATGGNTATSATVDSGALANTVLPHPTKPGVAFSGWFNTQSLLNGQRITTVESSDAGELIAGYVPSELAQNLDLDLPPPPPTCAQGGTCVLGDIGPGGGLVFLINLALPVGNRYFEMAPKNWNDPTNSSAVDPALAWCNPSTFPIAGATGTAIGTGEANTMAMVGVCSSGAGISAAAYTVGVFDDWFLPSKAELNAIYLYQPSIPTGLVATYGLASDFFWSSSQSDVNFGVYDAFYQYLLNGNQTSGDKDQTFRVRPVRTF